MLVECHGALLAYFIFVLLHKGCQEKHSQLQMNWTLGVGMLLMPFKDGIHLVFRCVGVSYSMCFGS